LTEFLCFWDLQAPKLCIKALRKHVGEINPKFQFHQHFTCSFCERGAQKHKKTVKSSIFLRFQDLRSQKLHVNMLVKSNPGAAVTVKKG